ncbi:MAG: dTMP kinase [Lentisphaerae bacterium]|nr:dTMP kinase [Lentisphaerota bacterium]
MRGLFITCEGPEGSGKSTHSRRLAEQLRVSGVTVLHTREPGGTPTGEAVRQLLQHDGAGESPVATAEVLLFCASRAQLTAQVIVPALERGTWVVCDRFTDSTLAYQGYGRGFDLDTLRALNTFATGGLVPDLTLLFDIGTQIGFQRVHARTGEAGAVPADRFERESRAFHEKIRNGFLDLASREPRRFRVLDTAQPVEAVCAKVWQAVLPHLPAPSATEEAVGHAG